MGWETIAIAGFSALQAGNTLKAGQDQGKAIAQQAEQQAQNTADNTVRAAGKLTTSFLQSGLTLDGGPMDVLSQAFAKGNTDIGRIASNANTASKNAVNASRTKALQGLASTAGTAAIGNGIFSGLDSATDELGQVTGSWLDPSPTGPYLDPFSQAKYQITGSA